MREFQDRPKEKWALLSRQDRQSSGLLVFVHGWNGDYLDTWGNLPTLLRNDADSDTVLSGWDFLFLGYRTKSITCFLDIADLIGSRIRDAASGSPPFLRKYDQFALVGHSLGTLGIRQLLCAATLRSEYLLTNLKAVLLFGSPLNGSPLALLDLFGWLGGNVSKSLEPGNPQLRMLREWTRDQNATATWPPVLVILGLEDKVVGHKYRHLVTWPGDGAPVIANANHSSMVKPSTLTSSSFIDQIRGQLK